MIPLKSFYARVNSIRENEYNGGKYKQVELSTTGKAKDGSKEYDKWEIVSFVKDASAKKDTLVEGNYIKVEDGGAYIKQVPPKGEDGKWAKDAKGNYKPLRSTLIIFDFEIQPDRSAPANDTVPDEDKPY